MARKAVKEALSRIKKTAKEIKKLQYKLEQGYIAETKKEIEETGGVTIRSLIMRGPGIYHSSTRYVINDKEYTKETLPLKWADKNICDFSLAHDGYESVLTLMFSDMSTNDYIIKEDDILIQGKKEYFEMNKQRRSKVEKICTGLRKLQNDFEELLDEERDVLDNYPENLQMSYRYDDAVDYLDELDGILEGLDGVISEFESVLR